MEATGTEDAPDVPVDRYKWGQFLPYEVYDVDSTYFRHLDDNRQYDVCSEHGFWPMSEEQYNNLGKVQGFLDCNHGNYRAFVVDYLSTPPPTGAAEASYHMIVQRRAELDKNDDDPYGHIGTGGMKIPGITRRHLDLAREVYGWAGGPEWAKRHGRPSVEMYDSYDYFEPWRVKAGFDYWVLPEEAGKMLVEVMTKKIGPDSAMDIACPDHCPIEVVMNAYDDDKPDEVIYCKKPPKNYTIIATRQSGCECRETWLDSDEMLKRRKVEQQKEREARSKRRRDAGENYFGLVMPDPNPADDPNFWNLPIHAQMAKFPREWSAADRYRAILVLSGSESKYQRAQRKIREGIASGSGRDDHIMGDVAMN